MPDEKNAAEQEPGKGEAGSRWSELYKTEDYWAIWLGLAIIAIGLLIFLPRPPEGMHETIEKSNATMAREAEAAPFRTIAWYQAGDAKQKLKATGNDLAGTIAKFVGKPHGWKRNPAEAFVVTEARPADSAWWSPSESNRDLWLFGPARIPITPELRVSRLGARNVKELGADDGT